MQYNSGARLDPSQVEVRGAGGKIAVGGGASILVIILALLFGINPAELMGASQGGGGSASSGTLSQCQSGADIEANRECRFVAYANTANQYWETAMGAGYRPAKTVLYSGQTPSGCGTADSGMGPFYCPNDQKVYIDPSFNEQMMQRQLGAQGGDAAEAYVIGHEYGHHVQNLMGTLERVQAAGQITGPDSPQVRLELQADCFAGAYLKRVSSLPNSPIASLQEEDLQRIVDAAQSVGDDAIQRKTTGSVNPDRWTHGSSQLRQHWLAQGFNSAQGPQVCLSLFSNAG